jgi:iron only hydrogenase large subunit-like protein/PAS domain-containing protein
MDPRQPIYTETAACQDCYKCVRECPVKAITVSSGHASVVGDLCVLCGHCVEVCPVGAKKVRSDVERAKALIALKRRTTLSLAPSFAAEFSGIEPERLVASLKKLGFAAVSETAIGADLVSRFAAQELAALKNAGPERPRVLLSTACPVIVDYVLKYRPELAPLLSRAPSPMVAHGRFLKSRGEAGMAVVFAGPCIAKKREADSSASAIDAAITFKGLRTWLESSGLEPARVEAGPTDRFSPERASRGVLYPVDGGMIASIKRQLPGEEYRFVSYSGLVEIEKALEGVQDYSGREPIFIELLSCEGGCVNGPRCERRSGSVAKHLFVLDYARGASEREAEAPLPLAEARAPKAIAEPRHSEEELREALRLVGKHLIEDELNCSGCGYDSCRAFAAAMLEGKAERTMCVSYMRDLAQKKANALVRAMPSGVVVADASLKVVECNENFVHLLGSDAEALYEAKPGLAGADLSRLLPFAELFSHVLAEEGPDSIERDLRFGERFLHGSIFVIDKGSLAGGVFQDVTQPCIQRDRIVSQAKTVIDKNLRTVQRIAYLLGENAADTEASLESIIESFAASSKSAEEEGNEGKGGGA